MEGVLNSMEKNVRMIRGFVQATQDASNKVCCLKVLQNTKPTDAIDKEHDRQNCKFYLA